MNPLAENISKGIWYRRLTGVPHGAELLSDGATVRFWVLDPNTLEEGGKNGRLLVESFYCFYCRSEQLSDATGESK
jgi:hypothetical protein